jgi:hypothetical protein
MKKARNWVPNNHTIFFRNQFLETEARNQFLRNCDASKQALSMLFGTTEKN